MASFSYCRLLPPPTLPIPSTSISSFTIPSHPSSQVCLRLPFFPLLRFLSEMGLDHHLLCGHRLSFIVFSLLFLIVSSWTQQGFVTEGRKTPKQNNGSDCGKVVVISEEDTSVRARIGSRPPKCEGRCSWCGHCEAIQVPTNPQVQKEKKMNTSIAAYGRGDESTTSNYKPMSWKCKCGNLIFNP